MTSFKLRHPSICGTRLSVLAHLGSVSLDAKKMLYQQITQFQGIHLCWVPSRALREESAISTSCVYTTQSLSSDCREKPSTGWTQLYLSFQRQQMAIMCQVLHDFQCQLFVRKLPRISLNETFLLGGLTAEWKNLSVNLGLLGLMHPPQISQTKGFLEDLFFADVKGRGQGIVFYFKRVKNLEFMLICLYKFITDFHWDQN